MHKTGTVYLVGAGPGDAGLLTLRGAELLRRADVVLYDLLVNPEILRLANENCELIARGKRQDVPQEELNMLMIAKAREGKCVVRLKGGDPYIFSRGGEEAEALVAAKVPFEVVSGVSSISAALNAAGIPLTHRGLAGVVTFVSGHSAAVGPGRGEATEWAKLAGPGRTLVVYMGVRQAVRLRAEFLQAGLPRDFPLALVTNGTRPDQQILHGTIDELSELAAAVREGTPGLLIIGQVAARQSNLCWPIADAAGSVAA